MEVDPQPPRRRWPLIAAGFAAAIAACLGVAGGAARATDDAAGTAASLAAHGQFAQAAALYQDVATRHGVLFVFARGTVDGAPRQAQRVLLGWAAALAKQGKVDQANALINTITDPVVRREGNS